MTMVKQVAELKLSDELKAIETAIVELAAGMRALSRTRLKRDTIVLLLHSACKGKVGKRQIEDVLDALERLERDALKLSSGNVLDVIERKK